MTDIVLQMEAAFQGELKSLHFFSRPGVGKTAIVRANAAQVVAELSDGQYAEDDVNIVYLDGTSLTADTLVFPVPKEVAPGQYVISAIRSQLLTAKKFPDGRTKPTVIIVDDSLQAHPSVANALKELKQSHSLNGESLVDELNLHGVVFLDNISLEHTQTQLDAASGSRGLIPDPITLSDTQQLTTEYLAEKYDVDPKKMREITDLIIKLPEATQEILNWRSLEHVIWDIKNDLPPVIGLGADEYWEYFKLLDKTGNDVTDETFAKIGELMGKQVSRNFSNLPDRVLEAARRDPNGVSVRWIGGPGMGKTERTLQNAQEAGDVPVILNAPLESTEMNASAFPSDDFTTMVPMLRESYVEAAKGVPTTIILDEASLLDGAFKSLMHGLANGQEMAGVHLNGCKLFVALENPSQTNGQQINDASPMNLTFASRFFATIITGYEFDKTYAYLQSDRYVQSIYKRVPKDRRERYKELVSEEEINEVAKTVCDWHANVVSSEEKDLLSPRTLAGIIEARIGEVMMIKRGRDTANLQTITAAIAKLSTDDNIVAPYDNKPALASLRNMLNNITVISLPEIANNLEVWLDRLQSGSVEAAVMVQHALRTSLSAGGPDVLRYACEAHALFLGLYEAEGGEQLATSLSRMVNAPGLPVTQVYWMELLSPNIDENGNEERLATAMQPGRAASITARKLAPNTSVEEFISMQDAAWKRVQTYLDKDDKSKNVSNNKGIGR